MTEILERYKGNAIDFYDLMLTKTIHLKPSTNTLGILTSSTIARGCLQGGRPSLSTLKERPMNILAGVITSIKRVIAEGNYVVLHCYPK
jgi:hypothetical protein